MARLTDNDGKLLGGIEVPLAQLLAPLNRQTSTLSAITALPDTTRSFATPKRASAGDYLPNEVVFALECGYGSLDFTAYCDPSALQGSANSRKLPPHCHTLIEEPEERHYCQECWGFYCHDHAESSAHDCASHS